MIRIKLKESDRKISSLSVSGHANSAAYGEDLVCAGVSSIMTGALNGLDLLFPEACSLSMERNIAQIEVIRDSACLQKILGFLVLQLRTMQEAYPDSIKMEKKEV